MSNKRHTEPLLWSLFGAGGTTIAFFFPILILLVLGTSLEMLPADMLSYERMSAFFLESWVGKLGLIIALVPSYWACIHRVYHGSHDLGFHPSGVVKAVCYGIALLLSVLTIALVL